ncbi:MAG: hypothetical protein K0R59_4151 [Sphingobacterium sp.]|jgi:hypothetical protein|uniref:hypothetical protein n=1 Tax=Sphingobacterium sp. CZ-UAM TaxID=1933868 RepID=UPI0009854187|nr:hypothetical protein [Sphingobacterium sp. CZ-UAM]MDF2518855.1 hypothetical protein [Sphingobacterium sp.]OOG17436.1 hypothetical protein BWD42_14625 [Sphingobacterium sp. CZ-UAM]
MKYTVGILVLLCIAFNYSCKKDGSEKDNTRLIEFKNTTLSASNGAETSYLLEYDAQGRVTKVNEQQFHYGANGRVDYSRIALQGKTGGIEQVKIVRLSYHWDEQNRLKSVFVDSLYNKSATIKDGINRVGAESLIKDKLLTSYSYTSNMSVPSKIVYRKLEKFYEQIGDEQELILAYNGDNIQNLKSFLYFSPFFNNPGDPKLEFTLFSFFQYSTTINPLYPIYKQMGFNPIDINQVVSRNLENAFFSALIPGRTNQEMQPDWTKKTAVKITLDASGKPTAINYVVKGDFGDAKDVILSEVLLNYVYE